MISKSILLVEDNPQDEMLALRALRKVNLANQVDVVRDGQQAIDYLFQQGEFADRASHGGRSVARLPRAGRPFGVGLAEVQATRLRSLT